MAKNFEKACVIGGGVIGSSFTLLFAMGKMDVKSYNRSLESEAKTKKIIEKYVDGLIEKKVVAEDKETILSRISYTTNEQEAIEFADIVEECIPENYDVKKEFVRFSKNTQNLTLFCVQQHRDYLSLKSQKMLRVPKEFSERTLTTHLI